MSVPRFHSLDDDALTGAWDELATEKGEPFFARPGWYRAWAGAFDRPVTVATLGDGSLEAAAPVLRVRGGVISPVNQESPDYSIPAVSTEARARLLQALAEEGSVSLLKVGRTEEETMRSAAPRHRMVAEVMQRSPFIAISGDWDAYSISLRTKFRKELRRSLRRLEEAGELSLACHTTEDGADAALAEALEVESNQWKARAGTAIASRSETEIFYREVTRAAASEGSLRLWFLRLEGRAIAFALDVAEAGTYFGLKVGYHPDYARLSPGMVLQDETVKYAFEHGFTRFEFLGADEPYKMNWTKTIRERLAVHAFARTPWGTGAWLKRTVARPLVHRVRNTISRPG